MATEIIVDAAFPPAPTLWVSDMDTIGASGGCVYVYGDFTNYTPAHIAAALRANKTLVPIVVPRSNPPSFATVWSALLSYGFHAGPVVFDLEQFSEPPDAWLKGARQFLAPLGYVCDRYGTSGELGKYSPEDGDWIANWLRRGVLNPIPTLPPGTVAWQFVDDVVINGNTYDVSVMDASFTNSVEATFLGTLSDDQQAELLNSVTFIADEIRAGSDPSDATGASFLATQLKTLNEGVAALRSGGGVDVNALAAALANNGLFVKDLAVAVAQEIGNTLSGAK